jgi:hypothetical protein
MIILFKLLLTISVALPLAAGVAAVHSETTGSDASHAFVGAHLLLVIAGWAAFGMAFVWSI